MFLDAIPLSANLTCMFGAFVFLQFTVLGLANHAGEGYLSTGQRDLVYYALQIFVILGYLLHALYRRRFAERRGVSAVARGVFGLFFACVILLCALGHDSLLYVIVSMAAGLCVGAIGGTAHVRMSLAAAGSAAVARSMGLGSSAAVVLQYLLQIRWGVSPLLPVFMGAAFALFAFTLTRTPPQAAQASDQASHPAPTRRIVFSVLIASTFILFACFYNESIHHLMIQSGYASSVYSWPRLMMIPVYLLFTVTGDRKNGRYMPIVSLYIMLIALLNVILIGNSGSYWLNMCFFYFAIAAYTCYYLLTFWRLAPQTRHPTFWAPFGRMLDSVMVLFTGAIRLSTLPAPVVLGVDIAGVALVILLMALGGDFNLSDPPQPAPAAPEAPPLLTPEETLERMRRRYALTDREMDVLQKLLLTDDELQPIADSLFISRRVLGRHISALYQKTGAKSRVGLYQIYHALSRER
ncbi:MAG: helix-turn-helix transcriptional regulator [Clostridia bacterium]|nr:helix-turn-helix transcriptional regulator [Clostridia bacterium]